MGLMASIMVKNGTLVLSVFIACALSLSLLGWNDAERRVVLSGRKEIGTVVVLTSKRLVAPNLQKVISGSLRRGGLTFTSRNVSFAR